MEITPDGTREIIAAGTVDARQAGIGIDVIGTTVTIATTVMNAETAMIVTTVGGIEAKRRDI